MPKKQKQSRPKRVQQHKLESRSGAIFAVACPDSWAVHTIDGSLDYGRDRWVEVFDDGDEATGIEFGVQLKSAAAAKKPPSVKLKRTTLNLWESLPTPTLIFFYDKATDSSWYEWAHLLPWEPAKDTKTRTVRVSQRWGPDSPVLIEREATAFRAAARVVHSLPLDVVVSGESFLGVDSGPLVAALTDYITQFAALRLRFSAPNPLHAFVQISDAGLEVSVAGMRPRSLTYGDTPPEIGGVAADAMFALALHLDRAGAVDLGSRLVAAAARESYMIISAGRLSEAVVILMQAENLDALETLLQRSALIEDHPNTSEALVGILSAQHDATSSVRSKIADWFEGAAQTWAKPATALSIAAQVLGHVNRDRSRTLWQRAAAADSAIVNTIPYLQAQGGLCFQSGRYTDAVDYYRRAVTLGEEAARPLLADALMWDGKYAEALVEFGNSDIMAAPEHAEWRLKCVALDAITQGLQIAEQARDDFAAEMKWNEAQPNPSDGQVQEVIESDALYAWAHWRLCAAEQQLNQAERFARLAIAAVSLPNFPPIWQEFACCALSSEDTAPWVLDIMLCIRRFCGPEFVKLLHLDSFVDLDTRKKLLFIYEHIDEYTQPMPEGSPDGETEDASR
ncbi:DUF4365 domain-containing protein [Microbacterium maritypicum]|uniref:DUF4365 domain-containing protein n=1 Tax=Microbacterium maritypicum TaxID=33918 RepID=UPI0037F3F322